jgi:glycine cleavage system aminomethyltransferase T/glycine/D-amino acid oxidase-like deaminating enzyme
MTSTIPARARVVVLGGGVIGASIAYHLAKRGVKDVLLLERDRIASGTTWHAAGVIARLRESKAQSEIAQYTADLLMRFEEETGQATGYRQNGSLSIALTPQRMELYRRSVSASKRMGTDAFVASVEEIRERWPLLNTEGIVGGAWIPGTAQVNPYDVAMAYIKGARQNGAQLLEQTPVEDILVRDGRVVGVRIPGGEISCDKVVLAGGMWSRQIAKRLGVPLPLYAAEHYYVVTEPITGLPPSLPVLTINDERTYVKVDAGKLLIGSFEAKAKPWPPLGEAIPAKFSFTELPADLEHLEPQLALHMVRFPVLANSGIKLFFCGPESFTADSRPFMGPTSDVRGLYLATGLNSYGILQSGGLGKVMAEWIEVGLPPVSMASMHAQRAMAFQANTRYMYDRITEALGVNFTLHWPGHQLKTARGIRHFPVHDRLLAAGAVMGERCGWEIPLYFDRPGASLPEVPSLKRQEWFPQIERESHAARDAAVLFDQSCYGKFLIKGPDALRALQHVSANDVDVAVGRSVYTHWLNVRGGIEADLTITRVGVREFLVVTGIAGQERDRAWFESHVEPAWNVQCIDVTAAHGMFALSGPRSREILQSLTDADLSNSALPFGHAQLIDVGYGRAWVLRRSFFGELGYELFPTADLCRHVYEHLLEAGRPHGLVHAGFFAMLHCRTEKGFVHFGHDIGEEDTPLEAGLKFAVALDKPDGFIGREALVRQRDAGPLEARLVNLQLRESTLDDGPYLYRSEPIWRGDELVGGVTSGAWGFRVGASLGMGSVRCKGGVTAEWLREGNFEVEVAGVRHAVEVQFPGFYDPRGERLRS